MAKLWTICGAGRGVGKTTVAQGLCKILPNSLYIKHGHGEYKAHKAENFFDDLHCVDQFILNKFNEYDHIVVESNELAKLSMGDVIIFVNAPKDYLNQRSDALLLKERAHQSIGPCSNLEEWQQVIQKIGQL